MWLEESVGKEEVMKLRKLGKSQIKKTCYLSFSTISSGQKGFKTNLSTNCGSKLGPVFT